MVRTQIQLTDEQARSLRRLAHERHTSVSALIRAATDELIRQSDREQSIAAALGAVGGFRSGLPDVSERHDAYLADAIEP